MRELTATSVKRIVDDNKVALKEIVKSVKDAHLRHHHYFNNITRLDNC